MNKTLNLSKLREDITNFGLWLDASSIIMEACKSCSKNVDSIKEVDDSLTNISK